jgi:AcrR family transcriptional regulator
MGKTSLPRKEREKQRHRREILDAALNLFSEKGFHDVSMQEIADESEFSVGTLYNFFENKDALFSELIRDCAHKIHDIMIPILEEKESETERIKKFIRAQKRIVEENAQSIKMYLLQYPNYSLMLQPKVEPEVDVLRDKIQSRLSAVIKSGMQKGLFKDINPDIGALLLTAQIESLAFRCVMYPEKNSVEDGISTLEKLFLEGILKK